MITPVFNHVSSRATWEERVTLYDTETEEPIDLSTEVDAIWVTLRDKDEETELLSGSLADGTVFLISGAEGTFGWRFTKEQMQSLAPKTYEVGVLVDVADERVQVILGRMSVVRGL